MSFFRTAKIILFLFLYDLAYISSSILTNNDVELSISNALLTSMVVIILLMLMNSIQQMILNKAEMENKEKEISKQLRKEYQSIHKTKVKTKMTLKIHENLFFQNNLHNKERNMKIQFKYQEPDEKRDSTQRYSIN